MLNLTLHLLIISAIAFSICDSVEFLTLSATLTSLAASIGFAGYKYLNCHQNECCDKTWINFNYYGFLKDAQRNLFGQHLVNDIVSKSLKAHVEKKNPSKALVMSFHGPTGSGKNHVSKLILKNLYTKGIGSQYAHLFIGARDFAHPEEIPKYRARLQTKIEKQTKLCDRSVFIFDELDKMPPAIFDSLTPYLDYHDSIDGIDYRKNIFIFLSNAGATNITKVALDFWANGKNREEIKLKDLESLISKGVYNEIGGLQHSDIVKRELIDIYVPFLPLERKHLKQCIADELVKQGLKGDVEFIAEQFEYYPPEVEAFSVHGCKKTESKVALYAN